MTPGLKTTIIASSALAGLLNLVQLASSNRQPSLNSSRANASVAQPQTRQLVPVQTQSISQAPPPATPTPVAADPTPAPAPSLPDPATAAAAKLAAAGLKPGFAASYLDVQGRTGTPWQLLAAVHKIETGQAGHTAVKSSAGATGPWQFMPATFAHYGMDGDGNGTKDITNYNDSALAAGRYLAANGAAKGSYQTALYHYNHSNTYVNNVLAIARRLGL